MAPRPFARGRAGLCCGIPIWRKMRNEARHRGFPHARPCRSRQRHRSRRPARQAGSAGLHGGLEQARTLPVERAAHGLQAHGLALGGGQGGPRRRRAPDRRGAGGAAQPLHGEPHRGQPLRDPAHPRQRLPDAAARREGAHPSPLPQRPAAGAGCGRQLLHHRGWGAHRHGAGRRVADPGHELAWPWQ